MKKMILALVAVALSWMPYVAAAQSLNPTPGIASVPNVSEKTSLNILSNQVNPSTRWTYVAASGGITDTTAVTIKAAAGASKRNYIRSCQIGNSGASGAAGTVLWRGWAAATQPSTQVTFDPPLQSAANTLLEVDMSSGTTIAVRVNCQGWTD